MVASRHLAFLWWIDAHCGIENVSTKKKFILGCVLAIFMFHIFCLLFLMIPVGTFQTLFNENFKQYDDF